MVRLRREREMDTCRSAVLLQLEDGESVVFGKSLRRRAAGLMKWSWEFSERW
jgi:hypothetical protein